VFGVTVASAVLFYALSTHATFNPLYEQPGAGFAGRFFFAQATALIHGHLNVPPDQLPGECFVVHGQCFGYFGLTPSLLRVPFLPILNATGRSFDPVFIALALTLAAGSAAAIAARLLAAVKVPRAPALALVLSVGPASVLVLITRPAVYEEAIAWSVGLGLLGVWAFLRWWERPERRWLALAVVALALSADSRPTTVPLAAALAAGIVIRALLQERSLRAVTRVLAPAVALAAVPAAACLGTWWLKFGTPFPNILLNQQMGGPSAAPWWIAIERVDHNTLQGIRFLPTGLIAYLRPDDVTLGAHFFPIHFRFSTAAGVHLIGLPQGSYYIEPFSTVTDDMPIVIVACGAAILYELRRLRGGFERADAAAIALLHDPLTYAILGAAAGIAVMLSNAFITFRYVADWFPLIALSLPVAMRTLAGPIGSLSRRGVIAVSALALALVLWALLADLSFNHQYWWQGAA
jgi:hypothetical protein